MMALILLMALGQPVLACDIDIGSGTEQYLVVANMNDARQEIFAKTSQDKGQEGIFVLVSREEMWSAGVCTIHERSDQFTGTVTEVKTADVVLLMTAHKHHKVKAEDLVVLDYVHKKAEIINSTDIIAEMTVDDAFHPTIHVRLAFDEIRASELLMAEVIESTKSTFMGSYESESGRATILVRRTIAPNQAGIKSWIATKTSTNLVTERA